MMPLAQNPHLQAMRDQLPFGMKWFARTKFRRLCAEGRLAAWKCNGYACQDGTIYGLGADIECKECDGTGWLVHSINTVE